MIRVFISYKSEDYEFANFLNSELNKLPGVVCDFDETLLSKGVCKVTDITAQGTIVNFIVPILTLKYVKSNACMTELELACRKNLDISNIGSVIPIVYDKNFDIKTNTPPIILNYSVEKILKDDFFDFKKRQLDALGDNKGKVNFDKLESLINRIMVVPLIDNRLRFDHTFWDMYESLLDIDRKLIIKTTQEEICISVRNQSHRIESEIPLTFYGPLNLTGYSKLMIDVKDESDCRFDVWGDKMLKIAFNNLSLISNNRSKRSDNIEYICQTNGMVEYNLPQTNSLFNKICIVIAPGLIKNFKFGLYFK